MAILEAWYRTPHLRPDGMAVKAVPLPAQGSSARRLINVFCLSSNGARQLEAGMELRPPLDTFQESPH